MKDNPPHDYIFWTSCVNSVGDLINEMRDSDGECEITYETMLAHAEGLLEWARYRGYATRSTSGLTLKNDFHVSYHKSFYCGVPCYYLVWSGFEHIWIEKGRGAEVQAVEDAARATARPSTSLLARDHVSDELIPGGAAEKTGLTPADVDPEQLRIGIEVELEHTDDPAIAQEIALDHLAELPDYYTRLKTIDPHEPEDNPDRQSLFEGIIVPDSSWFDPDELWGRLLVKGDPACGVQSNPPKWMPLIVFDSRRRALEARDILRSYGIKISGNKKTLLCLSQTRQYSCRMTSWCEKFCYGKSQNFCRPPTVNAMLDNYNAFEYLATANQQAIDDVAWAVITVCLAWGVQNLRLFGIGDLTPGLVRVVDAMTAADPNFTVWGFTRKHDFALGELPVRDNLVIWASIDATMPDKRIDQALAFVDDHNTGLSYATELGAIYQSRDYKNPEPPWWTPPLHPDQRRDQEDTFLADFVQYHDLHVVFGYHGNGMTTHVGGGCPECPATDPLGGGHFEAACQECYWCIEKPAKAAHLDLVEHRLNTVAVIPTKPWQGTRVLLDTGEKL